MPKENKRKTTRAVTPDPNPTGRATLRMVAELAGVSPMTVSRVVRELKTVSEKTAARVREAIDRLNYRPDPALSALAAYRTPKAGRLGSCLAFLDCDGTPYSARVLDGVRSEAQLYGYTVEAHAASQTPAQTRHLNRVLYHRGIRGLLFGPSEVSRVFNGWDWAEFVAVSLGALVHRPALHSVSMDYFDSAFSGYHLLYAQGCRRIAHVVPAAFEKRTGNRWAGGYCAALGTVAGAPHLHWQDDERGAAFIRWLRRNRVDAILTIHDPIVGQLRAAGFSLSGINPAHLPQPYDPQNPPSPLPALTAPRKAGRRRNAPSSAPTLHLAFLNDNIRAELITGFTYASIAPETIGIEGLRVIHHLLLRHEFGLPSHPRTIAIRGTWLEACQSRC